MNIPDTKNLLAGMPSDARVWIYQADRKLTSDEKNLLEKELNLFVEDWKAHGDDLKAESLVFLDQFAILSVDERQALASGCSIDSSVRKIREIGGKLGVDFFERRNIAYISGENVKLVQFTDLGEKYKSSEVSDDTLIFDNSIHSVSDFRSKWIVKLKDSPAKVLI